MQTVHFQCGHCGNLMAVSEEFLGQEVRCPHCEQVVTTPAAEMAPAAAPPVEPLSPLSPFDHPAPEPPPPVPEVLPDGWSGASPQETAPAALAESAPLAQDQAEAGGWPTPAPADDAPPSEDNLSEAIPQPTIRAPRSRAWLVPVAFTLFSYSVLSTILVAYLYFRTPPQPRSPLEELPDVDTPFKGATKRKQESRRYKHDLPLPANLRVALGSSVTVGDLTVTPEKLEWRKLTYPGGGAPHRAPKESLVLTLRMENTSTDLSFYPTDPEFDRRVLDPKDPSDRPYTFLELEGRPDVRFFGGAFDPERGPAEGMTYNKVLGPGEKLTTLVGTDPEADVKKELNGLHGSFLWRVRVRRGLVPVRDREVSATAVIGVEFTGKDLPKS